MFKIERIKTMNDILWGVIMFTIGNHIISIKTYL